MEVKALKEILKPTTGKVVMFLVLMFIVVIFPLYPTNYNSFEIMGPGQIDTYSPTFDESELTGFTLTPLVLVIQGDFQWSEIKVYPIYAATTMEEPYGQISDYSANPAFLILYIPYAILAYIAGCFLMEYLAWWKNKNRNIKQIKDF